MPVRDTSIASYTVEPTPPVGDVTLHYDKGNNKGYAVTGIPADQTANAGDTVQIPATIPTVVAGDFITWNDDINGHGTDYEPGQNIVLNADLTLYAIWIINM